MDKENMKKAENQQYKKGLWSAEEDRILLQYVREHGRGQWNRIAKVTGLKRCGKSCRLRWLNYLSPNVKKGDFSEEEEDLIIRLHKLLGNRWSLIAGRVPGRTDNQVKNHWNTHLRKKLGIENQNSKSLGNSKSKLMGETEDERVVHALGLHMNGGDSQLPCHRTETEEIIMNHSALLTCPFIDEEAEWNEWMRKGDVEYLMLLDRDLNLSWEEGPVELFEDYTSDQLWQHI